MITYAPSHGGAPSAAPAQWPYLEQATCADWHIVDHIIPIHRPSFLRVTGEPAPHNPTGGAGNSSVRG